eukprot:10043708-Karenia_brevis.AAC.1
MVGYASYFPVSLDWSKDLRRDREVWRNSFFPSILKKADKMVWHGFVVDLTVRGALPTEGALALVGT